MNRLPKAVRGIPASTAAVPYPGRTPHWIKGNAQERIPHRWIVADSESHRHTEPWGETQTLRLAAAVRWRDDLLTGDHEEWGRFTGAAGFWQWVTGYCHPHGRTCLAFHNAAHDLGILDAFTHLPALGWDLVWANLDRDVSVVTWRGPGGTLVVWDTYTWVPLALADIAPMVGGRKPRLPHENASDEAWWDRCEADVDTTARLVRELLSYVKVNHLGNWQPSGAGMGHTTWRHRFMTQKVLVHDDSEALGAERHAMHAGRAEAWWHGRAKGGPFTEWDMKMSYATIAAECDLPAKLWDTETRPSRRVHSWALEHFRVLASVTVTTAVPVVPCRLDGRVTWPVGVFDTVLWDTELMALTESGGSYQVHQQWRYTRKPVLKEWAEWSIQQCAADRPVITEAQKTWVKHQSRAVIGRMGLRTPSWEHYSDNWLPGYTGLSLLTHPEGEVCRVMHVGSQAWIETGRSEAQQSVPQITSWIMSEARVRLWRATLAAGQRNVLHTDTDSLIVSRDGDAALAAATAAGLPGQWRRKTTWRHLEVTGPRHYAAPGRRQVPGVPRRATQQPDGTYQGEVWDSLAHALTEGRTGERRVYTRTWRPQRIDHRRPYQGETDGPALPIRTGTTSEEDSSDSTERRAG